MKLPTLLTSYKNCVLIQRNCLIDNLECLTGNLTNKWTTIDKFTNKYRNHYSVRHKIDKISKKFTWLAIIASLVHSISSCCTALIVCSPLLAYKTFMSISGFIAGWSIVRNAMFAPQRPKQIMFTWWRSIWSLLIVRQSLSKNYRSVLHQY